MSRTKPEPVRRLRCAIYTRKSSEEGLDMEFNSLDAQREACEAYIASQRAEAQELGGQVRLRHADLREVAPLRRVRKVEGQHGGPSQ
jgi:hypothetical protein